VAGIQLCFWWIDSGWQTRKRGSTWGEVEAEAKLILEANPDAYIVLRTTCHPDYDRL
tara:strand:- start:1226 stop:1396 length:171 start_codon:yes stop_codon:yes gene_type:complete